MKKWCLNALLAIGMGLGFTIVPHPLEAILVSVKAAGMGLVGVAYPQDALAGAFNPAGMADIGDRFDMGIAPIQTEAKSTVRGNILPINGTFNGSELRRFYNPDFGINKTINDKITVGLVFYNKGHLNTKYSTSFPILGTSNLSLDATQEIVAPIVTYKLNECHSFGIAFNIVIQSLKITGIQNFDNALRSSKPGFVTDRGRSFSEGFGVTLGWRGQITEWLSLGVAYQPKIAMKTFPRYKGFLAEHGKLDIPQTASAGFAVAVLPCMNVAFDFNWINWEQIRALSNPLAPNFLTSRLGEKNGAGFGWRDQYFYRLGVDYEINDCWTIRGGCRYAKMPIRASQTAANLLTLETIETTLNCGLTRSFCCGTREVSFFFAHAFQKKLRGNNSIPSALGGGDVDLQQEQSGIGISYGMYY